MNGGIYAQCATLNISKPFSFHQLTLNCEPWNFEPESYNYIKYSGAFATDPVILVIIMSDFKAPP
jgi:hypothetical protein